MKSSGIGGQAVMEGIMMRNGSEYSVAVRKENGEKKQHTRAWDQSVSCFVFHL